MRWRRLLPLAGLRPSGPPSCAGSSWRAPARLCAASAPARALPLAIGLEIHAQLAIRSKLFSQCRPDDASASNGTVSPFDAAFPGALPRLAPDAIATAARLGIALGAQVAPVVVFDRKHYTYADLPHGFQITQKRQPLCTGGHVDLLDDVPLPLPLEDEGKHTDDAGATKRVRIQSIQLEIDSGKTTVSRVGSSTQKFIDLNRAGMPLVEVVTEPDATSAGEAIGVARAVQRALRATGACAADMSKGEMRVDVNISVSPPRAAWEEARCAGQPIRVPVVEVKNLNSFRAIRKAIEVEQERLTQEWSAYLPTGQVSASDYGDPDVGGVSEGVAVALAKETRRFDGETFTTKASRSKETALDYRFMPEPDIPPRAILPADVARWSAEAAARIEAFEADSLGGTFGAAALKRLLVAEHARGLAPLSEELLARLRNEAGADGAQFFLNLHRAFAATSPPETTAQGVVGHSCDDLALWMLSHLKGSLRKFHKFDGGVSAASLPSEFANVPPGANAERCSELLALVRRGTLPASAVRGRGLHALLVSDPSDPVADVITAELGDVAQSGDAPDLDALFAEALTMPGVAKRIAKARGDANARVRLEPMLVGLVLKSAPGGPSTLDVSTVRAYVAGRVASLL